MSDVGLLRIAGVWKEWSRLNNRSVAFDWSELYGEEAQKRLSQCEVLVCEPLYAPHYDEVDGQIWAHGYSHPEEAAQVLRALLAASGGICILLLPTPKFQLDAPDIGDVLWVFPARHEKVKQLVKRYKWARDLEGLVSRAQLEQFARRSEEFAKYLLERYRKCLPLPLEDMPHYGATITLVKELVGDGVELKRNPVLGLKPQAEEGLENSVSQLFGGQAEYVVRCNGDWHVLAWVGSKENALIVFKPERRVLVAAFQHPHLTCKLLSALVRVAEWAREHRRQTKEAKPVGKADGKTVRIALKEALEQYEKYLEARGTTEKYRHKQVNWVRKAFALMSKDRADEVEPADADRLVLELKKRGLKNKTIGDYIAALKQFFRLAVERGWLEKSPVEHLKKPNVEQDARERRALSADEVRRLLEACTDEERNLLYLTAVLTGLRLRELRLLDWSMVLLDAEPPRIVLPARVTKSRKKQSIPLAPFVAERLRDWRKRHGDRKFVFRIPVHIERYFSTDLTRARIERTRVADGVEQIVSFHSLRHTFECMLAEVGVPTKMRQELMRHSDVRTTMRYEHTGGDGKWEAVWTVEEVLFKNAVSKRATGGGGRIRTADLLRAKIHRTCSVSSNCLRTTGAGCQSP